MVQEGSRRFEKVQVDSIGFKMVLWRWMEALDGSKISKKVQDGLLEGARSFKEIMMVADQSCKGLMGSEISVFSCH